MQDEDRQTQEAFDAVTGEAMALTPPRVEDQALSPRSQAGRGLDPVEFARPSFEAALERFRSAGQVDVDPDDPALFNAYRRSLDYLGDMALGGLDLTDAAFRAAVGITAQALPEDQERSFARDLAAMPEAFMGYSPGRIQAATDRVAEGVAQVGRRLNQPGPMPTLGSNLGNLAASTDEPVRTSGRVINPLLSPRRSVMSEGDFDGSTLLTFYSPLRSAVEQMPIAREGSTGQTIMAYLNKRAPNVSSSELSFSNLNLDPQKRYTREEVLSAIERDTSSIEASYLTGASTRYKKDQRQNVTDPEVEYFEILLEDTAGPLKDPLARELTHFSDRTYAHSRSSVRSNSDGNYILIEELQSDPLQHGGTVRQLVEYEEPDFFIEVASDDLFEPRDAAPSRGVLSFAFDDLFNANNGRTREEIKAWYKDNFNIEVSGRDRRALHLDAIRKTTTNYYDNEDFFDSQISEMFDEIVEEGSNYRSNLSEEVVLPFNTNTQYVRNLLLSNIAKAKNEGIDRIVIPPLEELVRPRGTMEELGPAFRQTYQNAVRKAINILNNDTQGQIRLGSQTLTYPDLTEAEGVRKTKGLLLDISDFNFDPQTQAVRFAEGGVVSMEEQMSLFDMGGLADDGAMRDPVSGNEVPPGSMAEEVRDDVPAMLSEGEYIVPADVVRYYGVKFFEDLRSQAKSGLMDMERNGRIGGEPVPAPGPGMEEELTPEEMQMLAELTGMYGGGMVRKGYQAGGLETGQPGVAQMTQQDFMNQAQQAAGFQLPRSIFTPPAPTTGTAPTTTPTTLYGPTGDVIVLMLPTDQARYNELLSQGYTTEPQEAAATMQESDGDDSGIDVGGAEVTTGGGFSLSDENKEALSSDPLGFGMDSLGAGLPFGADTRQIGQVGGFLGGVPGIAIGGLAGAAFELDNIAKAQAGLQVAAAQGLTDTPEYTALQTAVNTAKENLSGPARFLSNILGFGSGKNYAEDVGVTTGTTRTPTAPARTGGGTPSTTSDEGGGTVVGSTDTISVDGATDTISVGDGRTDTISIGGDRSDTISIDGGTDTISFGGGSTGGRSGGAAGAATGGQGDQGKGSGALGMKKGGLVARRKKPVAKKK